MTTIYFIRHAEADNSVRNGRIRPLTEKGVRDRSLVTLFLQDKGIDHVISSPFKRAVDTVSEFAEKNNLDIEVIEDFRERKSDSDWGRERDYFPFLKRQWEDFSYKLSDGECLLEVQERNIKALKEVLSRYQDKNIVIGTHGTALSQIIHYYDRTYGFEDFKNMLYILPWVVKMTFDETNFIGMEKIDLFHSEQKADCEELKGRLYLQSVDDELWDVYDSKRNKKGRLHRRADPLPQGDYHLVIHVWLQHSDGRFVITKRAPNKSFPNMWECTGGSAITGDDSIMAAAREVKEETGIDLKPEAGKCVYSYVRKNIISDIWIFRQEFPIEDVVLQEYETVDAQYASIEEIRRMVDNGEFIAYEYIEDLFEKIEKNDLDNTVKWEPKSTEDSHARSHG